MNHGNNPITSRSAFAPAAEGMATPLAWADAATQSLEAWLQWQAGLWQPCIDLQVAWLNYLGQMAGWPAVDLRGTEQLA